MAVFVYLFLSTFHPLRGGLPPESFLRLDPLLGLATALAARQVSTDLLWAVPLVVITLVLGRAFCGWACPLGTILDWVGGPRGWTEPAATRGRSTGGGRRAPMGGHPTYLKYVLTAVALLSALFTSLLFLALDPLSLLTRTAAVAVYPAANLAITTLQDLTAPLPILGQVAVWSDERLRGSILPVGQATFRTAEVFLALFAGLLLLNLAASRFWCRYLCPLGGLLGLLARPSLLKRQVSDRCNRCGICAAACRTGAIAPSTYYSDPGDCILCLDCQAVCPRQAISYGGTAAARQYDPTRRQALAALGVSTVSVLALRTSTVRAEPSPFLVRPPGAGDDFLQRCIRCGECAKVCPTSVLQPSWFEAGLEGLWTPVLVCRLGYCEWECTSCGQVCPTQAIRRLPLEEKQATVIGTAYIDKDRCIPFADNRTCIVCEEVCPTPAKAILLDPFEFVDENGQRQTVKRPRVIRRRCIGCGVCEYKCPVPNESAIRVYATNRVISSEAGEITAR